MAGQTTHYQLIKPTSEDDVLVTDLNTNADKIDAALYAKIDEPTVDGTSGQVLTTDGNGGRRWATVQGGGGGGAVIDDTAGHGDSSVVWSAGKTFDEVDSLKETIENDLPETKPSTATGVDLDFCDESGNVILRLKDGDIQTKNFSSSRVRQLAGKKWVVIGDSLTEHNIRATKNYHDYVAEETGITVVNLGRSGRGYAKVADGKTFADVVSSIPADTDVITIFGSGNDKSSGLDLGTATDTGTSTICGCINATLDAIFTSFPLVPLGIVTPTPWKNSEPSDGVTTMSNYCDKLIDICKRRGIPCLDLYHCSNLHPNDATFRSIAYSRDDGDGVHPDENGHKFISPMFREFLFDLI